MVKGSRILVPRVFSCRILSQIITLAFAPHFKSSVWLLGHAIADSFLSESHLFSFPQNVSAVLQKVMAVIWAIEKCLNNHGIYRQVVQVLMTCLKFLAYLINNGNWSPIGPSIIWPDVLRKNHTPLGRQIIERPKFLLLSYHKDLLDFTCFDAGLNIVGRSKRLLLDAGSSLYLQFSFYNFIQNLNSLNHV